MTWIEATPALAVAVVLVLLPGALVVAPLRLGFVARAAISGLVSVLCIGLAGIAFGTLELPLSVWQVFVIAAIGGGVVWLVDRRRIGARTPKEPSGWRWLLVTWIAAAIVIGVVAFAAVPSPERVSQTYDNVFHMSAIASILDGRSASSLTLRTLIETDRTAGFYPAAWHSLAAGVAQLTEASPTVAVNASWLAVAGAVWVPGAAWLAQVVLVRFAPASVGLVAMPLATAFAAMPYGLLTWGTLYPTFLATAILPAAVAVPILAGRAVRDSAGARRWRASALGALAAGAVVVALALAQPRVLASWVLLLAPLMVAVVLTLVRGAWRAGGAARRRAVWSLAGASGVLALAAAAAFAYLVVVLDLFDRPLEDRLGGPQAAATQTVFDGMIQVLVQSAPTGVDATMTFPAILLALAVIMGVGFAVRTRGLRWIVVAYAGVALLYVLAAGADDVFAKLVTALWYKDRYRLSSVLPVIGVTLATLGVLAGATWLRARRGRGPEVRGWAAGGAWLVAATSAFALAFGGVTASVAHVFTLPASGAQSQVVSQAQIDFIRGLGDIVPADQRVLGDPWDGSAWTQLYGDREPVFPHVNGQWDAARLVLAYQLDAIDVDPSVCAALDTLRVRYVLYNPHEFGGGDPSGNHFAAVHRAVEADLFTEVATDGESRLYRIDQCGPLPSRWPSRI